MINIPRKKDDSLFLVNKNLNNNNNPQKENIMRQTRAISYNL